MPTKYSLVSSVTCLRLPLARTSSWYIHFEKSPYAGSGSFKSSSELIDRIWAAISSRILSTSIERICSISSSGSSLNLRRNTGHSPKRMFNNENRHKFTQIFIWICFISLFIWNSTSVHLGWLKSCCIQKWKSHFWKLKYTLNNFLFDF